MVSFRRPHLFDWVLALGALVLIGLLFATWVEKTKCCLVASDQGSGWQVLGFLVIFPLLTAALALFHLLFVSLARVVALETLAGSLLTLVSGANAVLLGVMLLIKTVHGSGGSSAGGGQHMLFAGWASLFVSLLLFFVSFLALRLERDNTAYARKQLRGLQDAYGTPIQL